MLSQPNNLLNQKNCIVKVYVTFGIGHMYMSPLSQLHLVWGIIHSNRSRNSSLLKRVSMNIIMHKYYKVSMNGYTNLQLLWRSLQIGRGYDTLQRSVTSHAKVPVFQDRNIQERKWGRSQACKAMVSYRMTIGERIITWWLLKGDLHVERK